MSTLLLTTKRVKSRRQHQPVEYEAAQSPAKVRKQKLQESQSSSAKVQQQQLQESQTVEDSKSTNVLFDSRGTKTFKFFCSFLKN